MRIFDVPRGAWGIARHLRVAVHGTCRVHDPFEALAAAGELSKVWSSNFAVSHTLGEVRQMLQFYSGRDVIAPELVPFIFQEPDRLVSPEPHHRRMLENVDVFVIEVSDLRQVRYRTNFFQIQAFANNFVTKNAAALLSWYQAFSVGRPISEELVRQTLSRLPAVVNDGGSLLESVLRETHLESIDADSATRAMCQLMADFPSAKWIFASHFVVPGLSGTLMQDRAKLRDVVLHATEASGADFFDPSVLVSRHGRELVLANKGADIYHYNPGFHSAIGWSLMKLVQENSANGDPIREGLVDGCSIATSALRAVSTALNALLVTLHRARLEELDVDESGLYAHYETLLERNALVGGREIDVVKIVLSHLPNFDRYHVLRAGLGEMAFLLAAFGRETGAFDPFKTRLSAIVAGAEYLEDCRFLEAGRVQVGEGAIPKVDRQGQTLAVATQLVLTVTADEEEAILQRLEGYDAILFDPTALVRRRCGRSEVESLIERFHRSGFAVIRDFPSLNLVYCAKFGCLSTSFQRSSADGAEIKSPV